MGSDFIPVVAETELHEDSMKLVTAAGRSILLARHAGQVFGVANRCPHMGCSLANGRLKEYIVTCPCHGWSFDIRNGQHVSNNGVRLMTFECKIQDGKILVQIFDDI